MSKNVVIIDDSKFLVKTIKEFMEDKMGLTVVGVGHNGNEAIELFKELKPDVMTLDITMPEKDGEQALYEILTLYPDAKIIMMSAVRGETIVNCIKGGAKGFIEKPLKFNDPEFVESFTETINDVLAG